MTLEYNPDETDTVSVILVTFNSKSTILHAVHSIPPASEVIVVDNSSSDATAAILADQDVKLIRLPQNIGFGGASNVGAAHATREFVLFLNPDTILGPGAIAWLVNAARRNPNGAFNPELLDAQGKSTNRPPSRFLNRTSTRKNVQVDPSIEDLEVDVLSGAALFCRRDLFNAVGGFDPNLFLYFEDDDLSLRLLNHGCKLIRCRRSVVRHEGGASTSTSSALEQFKNYHWERSYRHFCHKHGFRYLYFKRLLMNAVRITGSVSRYKKGKFDKHFGRLLAIVGAEPKYLTNRLHNQWLISQPQRTLLDPVPRAGNNSAQRSVLVEQETR